MAIQQQATKHVLAIPPAGVDNAAFTSYVVDTSGYMRGQIVLSFGAVPVEFASLEVWESDSDDGNGTIDEFSSLIDFSDEAYGLPDNDTEDDQIIIDIDLRGRKRYLAITATAGDGSASETFLSVVVNLTSGASPVSADERNVAMIVDM